tara:strand:- start:363 stop:710 length:348 start_codon:yes stop_codon:yes gene_type:complete
MKLQCPNCQSHQVEAHNYAKKTGGAVGTIAGAAGGVAAAASGARIGAGLGMLVGPAGAVLGGLAGAIFGGIAGGAAGCTAGSALGEMIDETLLDNYKCMACGHSFSLEASPAPQT